MSSAVPVGHKDYSCGLDAGCLHAMSFAVYPRHGPCWDDLTVVADCVHR